MVRPQTIWLTTGLVALMITAGCRTPPPAAMLPVFVQFGGPNGSAGRPAARG